MAKNPTKVMDLDMALSEWAARPELRSALQTAITKNFDFAIATDAELSQTDAAAKSRLIYVVGLCRLLEYLRIRDKDDASEAKAKIALGYIRHAETSGLTSLLLGRSQSDTKLEEEITDLREQVRQLADAKARALTDDTIN